jgi:hypothetical protein
MSDEARKRFPNRKAGDLKLTLGQDRKAAAFPPGKVIYQDGVGRAQGKKHSKTKDLTVTT